MNKRSLVLGIEGMNKEDHQNLFDIQCFWFVLTNGLNPMPHSLHVFQRQKMIDNQEEIWSHCMSTVPARLVR